MGLHTETMALGSVITGGLIVAPLPLPTGRLASQGAAWKAVPPPSLAGLHLILANQSTALQEGHQSFVTLATHYRPLAEACLLSVAEMHYFHCPS